MLRARLAGAAVGTASPRIGRWPTFLENPTGIAFEPRRAWAFLPLMSASGSAQSFFNKSGNFAMFERARLRNLGWTITGSVKNDPLRTLGRPLTRLV